MLDVLITDYVSGPCS